VSLKLPSLPPILTISSAVSFKWIKGELIGRGTYGRVYLAYNITAAEFIAVKQVELPKTRSDKEDLRQQGMVASLKAEIELLKDLEHPKIVEYLGEHQPTLCGYPD
jgi:serine/threonine protein kinase